MPWQLWIALAILALLIFVSTTYGLNFSAASRDPRTVALGLFVELPLVLLGCMTLSSFDYVVERRYYWPLIPLGVFVVYSFASAIDVPNRRGFTAVLQALSTVYLAGYIAMSLAYIVFFIVPSERGGNSRAKLMGSELSHWPSMAVTMEFSPARRFVMGLLKDQPNSLLLTSKGGWFYWDPIVDRSRLYELNCKILRAVYVSGPVRIVFLTFDDGGPRELWYYVGHANGSSGHQRADCFDGLPDVNLLQHFPEEGVKVLES